MAWNSTYTQAVLEGDTANGEGLEELRDLLAVGLGVGGCSGGGVLSGSEVGDALSGLDVVGGMHFVCMGFYYVLDSSRPGMLRWKVSTLNTTLCPPTENLRSVAP